MSGGTFNAFATVAMALGERCDVGVEEVCDRCPVPDFDLGISEGLVRRAVGRSPISAICANIQVGRS